MYRPCINEGRHYIKNIETEIGSSLHEINIFFNREAVVDIFQREISNQFFRGFLGDLLCLRGILSRLKFLIKFCDFYNTIAL